jgi:hypothetical protein
VGGGPPEVTTPFETPRGALAGVIGIRALPLCRDGPDAIVSHHSSRSIHLDGRTHHAAILETWELPSRAAVRFDESLPDAAGYVGFRGTPQRRKPH